MMFISCCALRVASYGLRVASCVLRVASCELRVTIALRVAGYALIAQGILLNFIHDLIHEIDIEFHEVSYKVSGVRKASR